MTSLRPVPFPIQNYPRVLMAHGGGGRLMHQLIGRMFMPAFRQSAAGTAARLERV